jgi:Secretion system C-terminal sorting domain
LNFSYSIVKKTAIMFIHQNKNIAYFYLTTRPKPMNARFYFLIVFFIISQSVFSQNYPLFGPEIKVTINGLTFDAMEPFISPDGNTLFFNSLNSGGNTNLYYASKINDSTFNYIGLVGGCYDSSASHLDAVASHDTLGNFFWISIRDYPTIFENVHCGQYATGNVSSISRVYGDFYIYQFNYPFGWLVMDAAINPQGNQLYFCNAYFDFVNNSCVPSPCESKMGVAQKINDSTFNKLPNSDGIFSNINDTNYIVYAPQITEDALELYYTRILKNTFNTEICVSVRNTPTDTFSLPLVIYSNLGFIPEAASPSTDKLKIYYHQRDGFGIYHIYLRYRTGTTGLAELVENQSVVLFPNPTNGDFTIIPPNKNAPFEIQIYSIYGNLIYESSNANKIDLSEFSSGVYLLRLQQSGHIYSEKIQKW